MTEQVSEHEPVMSKVVREDAVVLVRRALERAESGQPRFPGEKEEARSAIQTLEGRLQTLKAKGVEFGDIELSVYVRQLAPGAGPMPLAS